MNPLLLSRTFRLLVVVLLFAQPGRAADTSGDAGLAAALKPYVDRGVPAGAVVLVADRD